MPLGAPADATAAGECCPQHASGCLRSTRAQGCLPVLRHYNQHKHSLHLEPARMSNLHCLSPDAERAQTCTAGPPHKRRLFAQLEQVSTAQYPLATVLQFDDHQKRGTNRTSPGARITACPASCAASGHICRSGCSRSTIACLSYAWCTGYGGRPSNACKTEPMPSMCSIHGA